MNVRESSGLAGKCRFCGTMLEHNFCDLGMSPLSNAYLTHDQLVRKEPFYPLHAYVCHACRLVQLDECEAPEAIFSDYAYFSSYSESWLAHARRYCDHMIERMGLDRHSLVVEIASNDGYLLQYFRERDIPVLGIEPARNVARVAREKGVPTIEKFFSAATAEKLAREGKRPDLLLGNNVLAHVPDLNDFVRGMQRLLKPGGTVTLEFPHLLRLIEGLQFDTIYHEHFSYFSFETVERIFSAHGLVIFDVDELATHGGSLRIYVRHKEDDRRPVRESVAAMRHREVQAGLDRLESYGAFEGRVREVKRSLLTFLIECKRAGMSVVGYGAPAKGNTLLNYCGIRSDFLDYTVDLSPHKQGRYLPGTHIPIHDPAMIRRTRPHYVLILPWNLQDEIMQQMAHIREWGGRFVVPIPMVQVL